MYDDTWLSSHTHLLDTHTQTLESLLRLWYHECCRVFEDRLVSKEDRDWFEERLQAKMADFGVKVEDVLGKQILLYGDFMMPNTDNKIYDEITDHEKVRISLTS